MSPKELRARTSTVSSDGPGRPPASSRLCTCPKPVCRSSQAATPQRTETSTLPHAVRATMTPRATSSRRMSPFAVLAVTAARVAQLLNAPTREVDDALKDRRFVKLSLGDEEGYTTESKWAELKRFATAAVTAHHQAEPLSPGLEMEALREMAQGKTNAAIATSLSVSESTVEKYANSIFSKLGLAEEKQVHRRVAAVVTFLREPT